MAYTKEQKQAFIDELQGKLEENSAVYLTNYGGMTVAQASDLRGRFRQAGVEFRVVKNTLFRKAMEAKGDDYSPLFDALNGQTAVAFTNEPAAPARVIKDYLKDNKDLELPEFKAAYVDGAVFDAGALDVLAALKSKDELVGDIIGLLLAPISNVVGALQAPGSNIVGALKTIAEKEEA